MSAPAAEVRAERIADLVTANHILADRGVVDGFGHVSVRDPADPEHFLLARSMAPALVAAGDILNFDLQGAECGGDGRAVYLERFIHAAIYRARPDIGAVVHSHSPAVVPFSVAANVPMRPVYHMSAFLAPSVPVFEIREAGGPATDMLIRSLPLAEALASVLGGAAVVLMRGHGSTVVGASLRQAVFRAVYAEVNARLQTSAMQLGDVTYLNDAEAAAAARTNDVQVDRAWQAWRHELASGSG